MNWSVRNTVSIGKFEIRRGLHRPKENMEIPDVKENYMYSYTIVYVMYFDM